MGATLVGALFGRKLGSVGNVGRAASTMKGASRAARERADIGRAEARVDEYREDLAELEAEFRTTVESVEDAALDFEAELEPLRVHARKSDFDIERLCLVWVPSRTDAAGRIEWLGALEG
jgi:hypothetical protein